LQAAQSGVGASLEAIAFGHVGGASEDSRLREGASVHVAFRLEINQYRGNERVQLNCQHLQLLEREGRGWPMC